MFVAVVVGCCLLFVLFVGVRCVLVAVWRALCIVCCLLFCVSCSVFVVL